MRVFDGGYGDHLDRRSLTESGALGGLVASTMTPAEKAANLIRPEPVVFHQALQTPSTASPWRHELPRGEITDGCFGERSGQVRSGLEFPIPARHGSDEREYFHDSALVQGLVVALDRITGARAGMIAKLSSTMDRRPTDA